MKTKNALTSFLKVDRSPQTTLQYTHVLTRMVEAIGPGRNLARIRNEDLVDYFADLRASGLKPVTLSGYVSIVKSFFSWCEAQRYVDVSPAKSLKHRQGVADPGRSRAIPPEELRRMVDYARITSPRNHALLLFMVDTGCRVGGAVSLTLDHLDLEQHRAYLLEKGGKWHIALFSEPTAEALRLWLSKRPHVAHNSVWTGQGPAYHPLARGGVADIIRRLAIKTGASRIWGPHSIRHSVGHAYARLRVPPTVTQAKLGHSDVATTMRFYYPHDLSYVEQVTERYPLAALTDPAEPKLIELSTVRHKHG